MSETRPILTPTRVPADVAADDGERQAVERIRTTGCPIPLVDLRTVDGDMLDTPRDVARPPVPARSSCAPVADHGLPAIRPLPRISGRAATCIPATSA